MECHGIGQMYDDDHSKEISNTNAIKQLENLGIIITTVQEIKWTVTGIQNVSNSVIYYSGSLHNDMNSENGFVIRKRMLYAVLEFKSVKKRICY